MAKQFQFRRGTTAENNAFKGAPGEVTYDIERKELRVHDGVTLGGKPIETSANLVHTIGNETINGGKTFTSAIGRKSSRKYSETDTSVGGNDFADTIIATAQDAGQSCPAAGRRYRRRASADVQRAGCKRSCQQHQICAVAVRFDGH